VYINTAQLGLVYIFLDLDQ